MEEETLKEEHCLNPNLQRWKISTFVLGFLFLVSIFATGFFYSQYSKQQKILVNMQAESLTSSLTPSPTTSTIPSPIPTSNEKKYNRLYQNLYVVNYDPSKEKKSLYYQDGLDYKKVAEFPIELEIDSILEEDVQSSARFILNTHSADVSETYLVDVKKKTIEKLSLVKGYTKVETVVAFLENDQILIREFNDEKITYYLSSLNDLTTKKEL